VVPGETHEARFRTPERKHGFWFDVAGNHLATTQAQAQAGRGKALEGMRHPEG